MPTYRIAVLLRKVGAGAAGTLVHFLRILVIHAVRSEFTLSALFDVFHLASTDRFGAYSVMIPFFFVLRNRSNF